MTKNWEEWGRGERERDIFCYYYLELKEDDKKIWKRKNEKKRTRLDTGLMTFWKKYKGQVYPVESLLLSVLPQRASGECDSLVFWLELDLEGVISSFLYNILKNSPLIVRWAISNDHFMASHSAMPCVSLQQLCGSLEFLILSLNGFGLWIYEFEAGKSEQWKMRKRAIQLAICCRYGCGRP